MMSIADAMSDNVISVGPEHTLEQAAALMASHDVGAAIVLDPDGEGPGIVTERDLLRSVAAGEDPKVERVCQHMTTSVTTAMPDQDIPWAARTMLKGGFRHLVVVDSHGLPIGVLSVRDVVREFLGEHGG